MLHKTAVIHPVELITGEDQVFINIPFAKQGLVLAHRISRSFEPRRAIEGLLRR